MTFFDSQFSRRHSIWEQGELDNFLDGVRFQLDDNGNVRDSETGRFALRKQFTKQNRCNLLDGFELGGE